jgi:recombination protein RecR
MTQEMATFISVTPAQSAAARALLRRSRRRGEEPDIRLQAIASAKPAAIAGGAGSALPQAALHEGGDAPQGLLLPGRPTDAPLESAPERTMPSPADGRRDGAVGEDRAHSTEPDERPDLRSVSDSGALTEENLGDAEGGVTTYSLAEIYGDPIMGLVDELSKLPGIDAKSAGRIAFHLLNSSGVNQLVRAIDETRATTRLCVTCFNFASAEQCRICRDLTRDRAVICVVREPQDIVRIERTGQYSGLYHALGGSINPMQGIGPDDLRVKELMVRLADGKISEIILATPRDLEGEATAAYLARLVAPKGISLSRLTEGLPLTEGVGYADADIVGEAMRRRLRIEI